MSIPPQFEDVPFTLAASSEMLFRSMPILDRVKRLKDLGFQVEIWDWTKHDIKALVVDRRDLLVDDRLRHRHARRRRGRRRAAPHRPPVGAGREGARHPAA